MLRNGEENASRANPNSRIINKPILCLSSVDCRQSDWTVLGYLCLLHASFTESVINDQRRNLSKQREHVFFFLCTVFTSVELI